MQATGAYPPHVAGAPRLRPGTAGTPRRDPGGQMPRKWNGGVGLKAALVSPL